MIQDGKKTRSDDCNRSDEIWAMSYSVISGIISANTALVLEVSPLRKGRGDGEDSGTEQVGENSEWEGGNQKLYRMGREKDEKGVLHIAHDGSRKSLLESGYQESHSTEWTSENSTMQWHFTKKTGFLFKHNAEDVKHKQKDYRLQPVVGTESKAKLNGLYVSAKASNQF